MKLKNHFRLGKNISLVGSLTVVMIFFQNCNGGSFRSINSTESSSSSSITSDTSTIYPTTPGNTVSTTPSKLSVVLSWDKSASTNIQGYRIYFGSKSGAPDKMIDVGATASPLLPEYEIINLDPEITCYAIVKAYDASGKESVASNEILISGK